MTNKATDSDHIPCVLIVKEVFDSYRRHNYEKMGNVCQTVSAFYGSGGGNVPIVLEYEKTIQSGKT